MIMNPQSTEDTIARRLVDFASGLSTASTARSRLIANPRLPPLAADVEVSAEDRERIAGGAFYNQF